MRIKDKDVRKHPLYKQLLEALDEAAEYIENLNSLNSIMSNELDYLISFIWYKGLEDEYEHFEKHARPKESEDLPFIHYTL